MVPGCPTSVGPEARTSRCRGNQPYRLPNVPPSAALMPSYRAERSINSGCFQHTANCLLRTGPTQCELSQQEVLTRPLTLTAAGGRGEGLGRNVSERDRAPGAG